ncbi:integrase core domain-containing protein [Hymenobacter arcticus]
MAGAAPPITPLSNACGAPSNGSLLNPANDGHHLHHQLRAYFTYYNHRRPHQSLGGQTPAQVFAQPSFTQA